MRKLIDRYQVWLLWRRLRKKYGAERIEEWINAIASISNEIASIGISSAEAAAAIMSLGIKLQEIERRHDDNDETEAESRR